MSAKPFRVTRSLPPHDNSGFPSPNPLRPLCDCVPPCARRESVAAPALCLCACISPEGELASQDPHQVANFVIHLIGAGDRGGDLVSQQASEPPAKPMNSHPDGTRTDSQLFGGIGLGQLRPSAEKTSQQLEVFQLALSGCLLSQLLHDSIQERVGPVLFEDGFRCQVLPWFQVAGLAVREIKIDRDGSSTSFLGRLPIPFIGQKELDRSQQERAEAARVAVGRFE